MGIVVLLIKRVVSKMKTKVSLVLLGLGLACGSAYAGAVAEPMPVSNDINVTAPDQSGMWSFGAMAVLMQPTNKEFNYADSISDVFSNSPDQITVDNHRVDEGYDWWFAADVTYAFPGNGRDMTLAYEGLHGTDTDHTSVPDLNLMHSTFSGLDYLTAEGETDTNYDAGDLVFGQKIDVGQRIRLHPFVGLRYAHLDIDETGKYYSADGSFFANGEPFTEDSRLDNTFMG